MGKTHKLILLCLPFLCMIMVNEYSRRIIDTKSYERLGLSFINPDSWDTNTCSWSCHNSSAFCEKHHIAYVRPIKKYIDPIYFGIIGFLQSTGNYGLANIMFLVIGWPLLMWYLLVKCFNMRKQLKQLRHD